MMMMMTMSSGLHPTRLHHPRLLPWSPSSLLLLHGGNECGFSLMFRVPTLKSCRALPSGLVIRNNYPQNADLPRYYSKKEKKPFPIPIVELRRAARQRMKNAKGQARKPVPPPRNGMLVRSLIPVAYEVMNARISLINNLKRLMKVVPVQACKIQDDISAEEQLNYCISSQDLCG